MRVRDYLSWRVFWTVVAYWLSAELTYVLWVDCGEPTDPWSLWWILYTPVVFPIGEPT